MIKLTALDFQIKESSKIFSNGSKQLKDEYGRTAEWYEEAGMPVPDDLLEQQDEQEEITEEDWDRFTADCYIDPTQIVLMVDNHDEGSTIYFKDKFDITVEETVEEIIKLIAQDK